MVRQRENPHRNWQEPESSEAPSPEHFPRENDAIRVAAAAFVFVLVF
jgi:hypothetical protein